MSINEQGITITPEGMAEIELAHERKEALLAGMRQERQAQYGQANSHIGVEIARALGERDLLVSAYNAFLTMALAAQDRGKTQAAQTLRALAFGVNRVSVEFYGKDADLSGIGQPAPLHTPNIGDGIEDDIAAAVRASGMAGVWAEDDEPEIVPSTEASISPEPDETPQRKAARQRREAKAKAQLDAQRV